MSGTTRTHDNLLALFDAADWETILRLTEDLSEADPPGFWFFRAAASIKVRRTQDSVAAAKRGVAKDPASGWGNRVLFDALLADGRTDEAFAEYSKFIDDNEDTEPAKAFYVQKAAELNLLDIASEMNERRDVITNVPKKPRFALGLQCFCKHDTLEKVFASLCDLDGADRCSLVTLQDSVHLSNNPEKYADAAKNVQAVIAEWLPRLTAKFFSVECLENRRNLGTAPTCRRLIDYIAERHDGFLFIEDDCILAPSALDWTIHHLEHTISNDGPWFVTCESSFFDQQDRPLDDDLKIRLSKIATYKPLREAYVLLDFVNSTCFGTRSDIWKLCASARSFTRGPESLSRFVAQKGMQTIAPIVPKAADIGMLHEFGYSVDRLGAANVREKKSVYWMSPGPFEADWCYGFGGDKDLIYRATCKLVPHAIDALEEKYANIQWTDIHAPDVSLSQFLPEGVRSSQGAADDFGAIVASASANRPNESAPIHSVVLPTSLSSQNDVNLTALGAKLNMLKNTLALLTGVKSGTYLPDETECYDPDEIEALGHVLNRLLYGPSVIRGILQQKYGVTITRADLYAEIPTIADLKRSFDNPSLLTFDAIFPSNDIMRAELDRLMKVSVEFDPPLKSSVSGEYAWENTSFSYSDAMAYYTMIRTRKPRTIIEIGGGWQTRVAQIACQKNGMGRVLCVDPNPVDFLQALQGIELVNRPVQDLETGFFDSLLRDGDLFFIDSTHTIKHNSDCLHLYLRILPAIQTKIVVQVHDVYLPDTLSLKQMRDQQIFWNEQYLLYAYMCGNPRTQTIYGSRYHERHNPDMLGRFMHGRYRAGGASFWFEQERAQSSRRSE